jgi:hypothetical protein
MGRKTTEGSKMSRVFGTDATKTDRFKRKPSNEGDRVKLEQAEARALFTTWKHTGKKVLTAERMSWIEKMYGLGAVNRIRNYMDQMNRDQLI